ncbi:hypothetical protein CTA1_3233 [Colletotrichum tanaceti]|uniref:Uncharacterized protein n=1 Tax=Colletotrichum tanaceti TaxID=1306861 RepID=A0A4U6X1E4_9PEZI|nr:hypothetical protein CTA1_3233 [Colletotrichum tanaceti]
MRFGSLFNCIVVRSWEGHVLEYRASTTFNSLSHYPEPILQDDPLVCGLIKGAFELPDGEAQAESKILRHEPSSINMKIDFER